MNISWFTNKAGILNKDELFKYININRHLLYDFLENQDFRLQQHIQIYSQIRIRLT
jgi:predicted transcriptional regulator